MKAILLFQARTPSVKWPEGAYYNTVVVQDGHGNFIGKAQAFRAVLVEAPSLSDALALAREHELPSDNFVNALPLY